MVPKVLIPASAIKRFQHKLRAILAPRTTHESTNAKIVALNRLTQGWCEYYRITSSPSIIFRKLSNELYWLMAHWLGRKYKLSITRVLRRYTEGNTFCTKTRRLVRPSEYKVKT